MPACVRVCARVYVLACVHACMVVCMCVRACAHAANRTPAAADRRVCAGAGKKLPCFNVPQVPDVADAFIARLRPELREDEFVAFALDDLLQGSYASYRTVQYDMYQKLTNGVLY